MRRYLCLAGMFFVLAAPAQAAGLSVRLLLITSPIPPGAAVTVTIATEPGAQCGGYREVHDYSHHELPSKIIEPHGRAHWTWNILPGKHPGGVRKVHIACSKDGRSGAVNTQFDVR